MSHIGEIISLLVACSWTLSALFSEVACRRASESVVNVYRMLFSLLIIGAILFLCGQFPLVSTAPSNAWHWLLLSGLVGYTFGDFCLYNAYSIMGARYGQLFMTLAPPFAALFAWLLLGQRLSLYALIGMFLVLVGICLTILARRPSSGSRAALSVSLPIHGVFFAIGAALGQGFGLVLSKIGIDSFPLSGGYVPLAATFIRCLAGLIGFVVLLFLRRKQSQFFEPLRTLSGVLLLVALAVFGPVVGVSLSLRAVQLTDVGIAQSLMATTPILIMLPSHIFFHTPLNFRSVVGTIISVIGVTLFFVA